MKQFAFIFISLLLLWPFSVDAEETSAQNAWDQLEDTSGQALELVKQEKYEDAKKMLEYFNDQFLDLKPENSGLSMKQLRILTTSYDHALRAVNSVADSQEVRITALTQFHLVVDALHSSNKPLWRSTKNQVLTPLNKMKKAAADHDNRSFQYQLNQFFEKYEMIHPALNVDLSDAAMERIDSEVKYLTKNRNDFLTESGHDKHLKQMDDDFRAMYNGTLKDSADPMLPWVIISIGGIIVVTLLYTGIRKYRGEKKKREKVKKRSKY